MILMVALFRERVLKMLSSYEPSSAHSIPILQYYDNIVSLDYVGALWFIPNNPPYLPCSDETDRVAMHAFR